MNFVYNICPSKIVEDKQKLLSINFWQEDFEVIIKSLKLINNKNMIRNLSRFFIFVLKFERVKINTIFK